MTHRRCLTCQRATTDASYCAEHGRGTRSHRQQATANANRGGSGYDWQRIRLVVFERDGFACRLCPFIAVAGSAEERAQRLRCDHISGPSSELSNLRTLCLPCHRRVTPHGGG